MTSDTRPRVALLWRGDADALAQASPPAGRLAPLFEALAQEGVAAESAIFCEDAAAGLREQLFGVDGVLVWVDPISEGKDRRQLDPILREVAAHGGWVSAHPDVILKMGVKEVLYRTRDLGWGTATELYATPEAFHARFPARLADGPRVLKQNRGNGGQGVWKVALAHGDGSRVEVLHARRGSVVEHMPLAEFMELCASYFAGGGRLVDQPFQARLPEGMIRCYMVQDRVVGFGRQLIKALMPPEAGEPGPRIMSGADYPLFQRLRTRMEGDWVPGMMRLLDIDHADLPVIWDADFLYGPKTPDGEDTYVLCEINVSAVLPIPEEAPVEIARCVARRLRRA
jgi:hypothetical protein